MRPEFDDRDKALLDERVGTLNRRQGPRVGDYVEFPDGTTRRISYDWQIVGMAGLQTSDGGSFYLGDGYVSFSGGLHPGIDPDVLTLTDETRPGSVWFFHHDHWTAHNGVNASVDFRVYQSSVEAPR